MPERGPLDFLREPPEKLNSWIYWATRATGAVRRLTWAVAAAVILFATFLISSFCPSFPLNLGWNTVEHVADPIPFHNFAAEGFTAMASSGRWLALAGAEKG